MRKTLILWLYAAFLLSPTLHFLCIEPDIITFTEALDPINGFVPTVKAKLLIEEQSPFQKIAVYETPCFGKMLTIDGIIQCTEYDNAAYHEMITHVPMLTHPNPKKVLIIGGGEGGALHEVLKYSSVEEVHICDIDEMVKKISAPYFPEFAKAYQDSRVTAVFQDGAAYIKHFTNYFDVIIVDSTDFYGVAQSLLQKAFYQSIFDALTESGMVVAQSESLYFNQDFIVTMQKLLKTIFPITSYYYTMMPSYPGGSIGFSLCAKQDFAIRDMPKEISDTTQYYTKSVHFSSFLLPKFLDEKLYPLMYTKENDIQDTSNDIQTTPRQG